MTEQYFEEFFKDRFVLHEQAQSIMGEMDHVHKMSKLNSRPRNLLIIALAGAGKTALINAFLSEQRKHNANNRSKIVSVQMPAVATEKGFMMEMLEQFNVDFVGTHTLANLNKIFKTIALETGLSLIVIDEFNNLFAAPKNKVLGILNILKWIGNEFHIPIVAVGTKVSNRLLTYDSQFKERYKVSTIDAWSDGENFRNFVFTYLEQLPGKDIRELDEKTFKLLLSLTSRTTNDVVSILSHSAYEHFSGNSRRKFNTVLKAVAKRDGYLN